MGSYWDRNGGLSAAALTWRVIVYVGAALTLAAGILVGRSLLEASPPEPTLTELQRQNAALRDSLEAERGWDTTPPGFIREICEVQNE